MGDFRLNRRTALIAVGAGAGVLAASPAYAAEESGTITPPTPVPDPSTQTLAQRFISQQQFVIAHRGAGDVNPEHTAYAYQQAILKGAQAIEISVRSTADGQSICMHDNSLSRTTTSNTGFVSSSTLAELQQAKVDMRNFLGQGTPLENISTLDQALDVVLSTPAGGSYKSVGSDVVFFIEAKDSASQAVVIETMTARGLTGQTVIKMYRNGAAGFDPNAGFITYAKAQGFMTWCYFDAGDSVDGIAAMAGSSNVDLIGLPYFERVVGSYNSMTDAQISQIVAMGKPVIVWEVHRRSLMERLTALGVRGFMSPDPYWLSYGGTAADLKLSTGRRQHGMLPAGQQNEPNMPAWENGALIHREMYDESIMLGPLAHLASTYDSYVVYFTMKWENLLPTNNWQYGYIAFGRQTDAPFGIAAKHAVTGDNGCYVLAIRPKAVTPDEGGDYVMNRDIIQLLRIDNGTNNPVPVKTLYPKQGFAPNKDINGKIIVRPDSITIDVAGARSEAIADTAYRGPYMHFGRYHDNSTGGGLALSNVTAYRL